MKKKGNIYNKVKTIIRQDKNDSSYIGEDDFVSLFKGNITVNFHIKQQNIDIENIFRAIKRAQNKIRDLFDYPLEKIEIEIYNSITEMRQDGRSRSRYASWIAGIFDGKIRLIAEHDNKEPETLYIILTHEIIHLAVYEISKGRCPYWLDEGLAVFLSQELPDEYLADLHAAVKEDRVLPIELLEKPLPAYTDGDVRQLSYAQCSSIAEYLVESSGWREIRSIIVQSTRIPAKTILVDMGLNYYLLEQAWKRWFRVKQHKKLLLVRHYQEK